MVKCLLCSKELEKIDCLENGGYVEISFHYGSRHDQEKGLNGRRMHDVIWEGREPTKLEKLLDCDIIQAHICDDCFEEKLDLMEGYKVRKETKTERVV